jgi:prepilin-type N-terminal cleavage/methylation domain-containing protein
MKGPSFHNRPMSASGRRAVPPKSTRAGFTLLEILFVVLIIAILAMLLLPVLNKAQARARSASCSNQLRQMGIALHEFSHDHLDQFPFQVSTNQGGTLEFARAGFAMSGEFFFAYRHFQILSNSLVSPRMLRCSMDTRLPADNFSVLQNTNLSYFIATTAEYSKPDSILCGDRNISGEALASGSIVRTSTNSAVVWTAELHHFKGNLLFSDSHVAQVNNSGLAAAIYAAGPSPGYLLPPVAPPPFTEPDNTSIFLAAKEALGNSPAPSGFASPSAPSAPGDSSAVSDLPAQRPVQNRPARVDSEVVRELSAPPPPPSRKLMASAKKDSAPSAPAEEDVAVVAKGETKPLKRLTAATPAPVPAPAAGMSELHSTIMALAMHPEQHVRSWLLLLFLVALAAFLVGRHLHRRRQRRLGPA